MGRIIEIAKAHDIALDTYFFADCAGILKNDEGEYLLCNYPADIRDEYRRTWANRRTITGR